MFQIHNITLSIAVF